MRVPQLEIDPDAVGSREKATKSGQGAGLPAGAGTPKPKLTVSFIDGSTVVRSVDSYVWHIKVKNIRSSHASSTFVDVDGPDSPADWHHFGETHGNHGFHCQVVEGAAIAPGPNGAQCSDGDLDPGQEQRLFLSGNSTVVIGDGNRTIDILVQDNFPNSPGTRASATFTYAVNPE